MFQDVGGVEALGVLGLVLLLIGLVLEFRAK